MAHDTHLIFSFVILLTIVLYLFLIIYLYHHLFLNHTFVFWNGHLIEELVFFKSVTLVSFQVTLEMLVRCLDLILDGGMERWSLFNWKYIYLLFKTLHWWVLYLSQIFFLFGYEQKVLPHKRGTLSKNLAAKFWKNKLSLAMQLQKFHFFLFLFSSQTRKLLKYKDPVEKTFNVRVRVELMTGKEPVQ